MNGIDRSWILISMLIAFLMPLAGVGCNSDDGEVDGDAPVFQPDGDTNTPTDGDTPVPDGDSGDLPKCKVVCEAYCDKSKECNAGSTTLEQYTQCIAGCDQIDEVGSYSPRIACGLSESCAAFLACESEGGNSEFQCDMSDSPAPDGDQIAPDGDSIVPDGDDETDGDLDEEEDDFERPEGYCQSDVYCPDDTHCDTRTNQCLTACDPYDPQCAEGLVCGVIQDGELAGYGYGICVEANQGLKGEGEACNISNLCRPELVCGDAGRCEIVCDPNGESSCAEGLSCKFNERLGVGTCAFCHGGNPCDFGLQCIDGYCMLGLPCDDASDCSGTDACLHGYCGPGCRETGCVAGVCLEENGYCYADICDESCVAGECCNRGSCGPCCSPSCQPPNSCDYHPSCYPDLSCCVKRGDCREMPRGYCGDIPCDMLTGTCRGACPTSCLWGYECGSWTGFECEVTAPQGCNEPFGGDCPVCTACDFWGSKQCVATNSCPIMCLDQGMACATTAGAFLPCCGDMACCMGSTGQYTCCPPQFCTPGVGCESPQVDGDDDYEPDNCPGCDVMNGEWCKSTSEGCPVEFEKYVIQRDSYYPCYFIVYHDTSSIWDNRVADIESCESQAVYFQQQSGTYDECILFWDEQNEELVLHCQGSSASCRERYSKAACQ